MGYFTTFPLLFLYFILRALNRTLEPSPSSSTGSGESQLSWIPAAPVGRRPGGPLVASALPALPKRGLQVSLGE